jgi:Flp pilus assembly protein TadG
MMKPAHSFRQPRAGAVAVEFALVAPVFFLLVLAGIEFGRINMIWGTIGNASYEGVRRAIIPGAEPQDAVDAAQVLLNTALVRGATITVDPPAFSDATTDITVTIDVDMSQNSWLSFANYSGGMHVSKSRTLARELYATDIVANVLVPPSGGGTGDSGSGDIGDSDSGSSSGDSGTGDSGGTGTGGWSGGGGGWWWWGGWGWW